uniref:Tethering factor for nuclear proteasome STS1 n=2 Tax=Stomoxys calcitrans TaxID=35570 RepID=A0A1I8NVE5_STOCA
MILRSSPRKRLSMGSTPPEPMLASLNSPHKVSAKQQLWPGSPIVKKIRLGDEQKPMAQTSDEIPLAKVLQGLSQQQLIDLIMDKMANDTKAEAELRSHLPIPDIEKLEQELLHAKRMIFKSLPTSRLCKKTDSTAFARASLHLMEFKRLLTNHTKQLNDSGHYDALLDYVFMAWQYVRATPNWDNITHNNVRKQCFKVLTCSCMAAIKSGGLRLGTNRIQTLEKNLHDWSQDYEDVMSCVNTINKTLSKGRTSL